MVHLHIHTLHYAQNLHLPSLSVYSNTHVSCVLRFVIIIFKKNLQLIKYNDGIFKHI